MLSSAPGGLFRDSVRERDLDNFLVEELQASDAFRPWLLAQLPHSFCPPTGADVRVQRSGSILNPVRKGYGARMLSSHRDEVIITTDCDLLHD